MALSSFGWSCGQVSERAQDSLWTPGTCERMWGMWRGALRLDGAYCDVNVKLTNPWLGTNPEAQDA